jgi:Family of unknown function (DUF6282)
MNPHCLAAFSLALIGVIDIHVHSGPDSMPRTVDAIDVARLARKEGMRGLVFKNHYESTAAVAYLVRKEVPGIEAFGGIDLNQTVGGINPAAVERMTMVTGGYGRSSGCRASTRRMPCAMPRRAGHSSPSRAMASYCPR